MSVRVSRGLAFAVTSALGLNAAFAAEPLLETEDAAGADMIAEKIVVVATRTPRNAFTTPFAVSTVDAEEIELIQPYGYQDIFKSVPGVEIQGGSRRVAEEPTIRGFSDQQVVTLIDGARQNFNLAHRGRFFVDPYLLKRIEVVRGSASALYGSGAIGGVIALETKDPADLLEPGQTFGGHVRIGYQSNGDELSTATALYGRAGNVDVLGNFVYRQVFDDFEDGDGNPILDSQDRILNGLFKLGVEPGRHQRLELFVDVFDNDGNNPTAADDVSSPTTVVDRGTTQTTVNLNYNYDDPGQPLVNLTATGFYTKIDVTEDRFFDGRFDDSDFESYGFDLHNTSKVIEGEDASLALTYGVEAYQDRQSGTRDGAPREQFPDGKLTFVGLYAQAELELFERLSIIPGVRWDRFDINSGGAFPSRDESEVTPRVSVGFEATDEIYFWASYAEAFRAPSLTEFFNDGIHFEVDLGVDPNSGIQQFVINEFIPSPDLLPEEAKTWEAGVRFQKRFASSGGRFLASFNYFHSNIENFVDTVVIFISGPPTFFPPFGPLIFPGSTENVNVNATIEGVEGELRYEQEDFLIALAGHILDGENRDTGLGLGSIPQNRLTVSAEKRWLAQELTTGARLTIADSQTDVPPGSVTTGAYETLDLYARWQPQRGFLEGATLLFGVDNVWDETYSIHPTVINQRGRSFKVSLSFGFAS